MCRYHTFYTTTRVYLARFNGGNTVKIDVTINGERKTMGARDHEDLATALRREGYTGVKCGCDGGTCGASKVIIDGETEMACAVAAEDTADSEIETIEGLGSQDDLHPIQQAFVDHFAVQCGFCIPGMIMEAKSLLATNPDPTEAEVRNAIDDNVCRCTGYQKPVEAILDAAGRLRSDQTAVADGGTSAEFRCGGDRYE
jgi:carbon-monoxide dehydrogenase small subunit